MSVFQRQIDHLCIDTPCVEVPCSFNGQAQFGNVVIFAVRDVGFSQQEIRGHVEQPCDLQYLLVGQSSFCATDKTADSAFRAADLLGKLRLLMLCSFIKSARRTLDGAGRYSCAMWSALLFEFYLIIIRSAVLFNIRFPLRPCCCSPATSEGIFLFPLQFCRFFALSAKFSVYSGTRQKTPEFPLWGTLVQHITSTGPVAAGCAVLWASNRLSTPARKKCIFSRKKFVQPVRSVLVRTRTASRSKLKRIIVYILCCRTPYRPYGLFEVRTQFFQMRTEQSSSHCANLSGRGPSILLAQDRSVT